MKTLKAIYIPDRLFNGAYYFKDIRVMAGKQDKHTRNVFREMVHGDLVGSFWGGEWHKSKLEALAWIDSLYSLTQGASATIKELAKERVRNLEL